MNDLVNSQARMAPIASGEIKLPQPFSQIKNVYVVDIDLLIVFSNGAQFIIPNGALEALAGKPVAVHFSETTTDLQTLFHNVGKVAAPTTALRLASENLPQGGEKPTEEAPPQPEVIVSTEEPLTPPVPALPVTKITSSLTKGAGAQSAGSGEGEGQVPDTVVITTPPPPVTYRSGSPTQVQTPGGDFQFGANGTPNFDVALFTSKNFKLAGTTGFVSGDLPAGAFDTTLLATDLNAFDRRSSPTAQAATETLVGTAGNDVIDHNTNFSASTATWVKTLNVQLFNISAVDTIEIVLNAAKIALIPGFDLVGVGVSKVDGFANVWRVDPTQHPNLRTEGFSVDVHYTVQDGQTPVDFAGDITLKGSAEVTGGQLIPVELTRSLSLTWREAFNLADFDLTDNAGNPMMVLPAGGLGYEIFAGDGDDQVSSGAGRDTLHGEAGNDTLRGGSGNDLLDGGLGADTLFGDAGSDTATYRYAEASIRASLSDPWNNVGAEAVGDTYVGIENLEGSGFDDVLVGDVLANTLTGGEGDDTLEGMAGADVLRGGEGQDTASYASDTSSGLNVSLLAGTGQGGQANDDLFENIENITGGLGNDTLEGNELDNTLSGGAGDDTLVGGAGADYLSGGAGFDLADYATADRAVVASLTPWDQLGDLLAVGDALGDTYASVENMRGTSFSDTLVGDARANTLIGGLGHDLLEGMAGADRFIGDDGVSDEGNDTVSYAYAESGVVVSLTSNVSFTQGPLLAFTGHAQGDTFQSIENFVGSRHNDLLVGDDKINTLSGGSGDDTLEGMAGADLLEGGGGSNTASYAHWTGAFNAGVTASLTNPTLNTGDAQGDTYRDIQNLLGSNFADTLVGDTGNNTLSGGAGNDLLEGKTGADVLVGGQGTDTASYANATTAQYASLMQSSHNVGNEAFGDNYDSVENLTGGQGNDTLVGDIGINTLSGGAGNDTLEGLAGADHLAGGEGRDVASYALAGLTVAIDHTSAPNQGVTASLTTNFLAVGSRTVITSGDAAGDTYDSVEDIVGSDFADTLIANDATNTLWGGAGDDLLEGMGGADRLEGGLGSNTASYAHATSAGSDAGGLLGVTASLTNTSANVGHAQGDVYVDIQHLEGSLYNDVLQGDAGSNTLSGLQGDDTLEGLSGADTLMGGAGNNTASYANAGTGGVTASLHNPANNTGHALGDSYVDIQNLLGSTGDDSLEGSTDNTVNRLEGGAGNDVLIGRGGGDLLIGGTDQQTGAGLTLTGGDTASYAGVATGVTASLTVFFSHGNPVLTSGDAGGDSYDGIENLTGSSYDDSLIGNAGNNWLRGDSGDDTLEGMEGADRLDGGSGNNTASYAHAAPVNNTTLEGITALLTNLAAPAFGVALTASGHAFGDSYENIANLRGSEHHDTLVGNTSVNTLTGGSGDDTLEGLAGADVLDGGLGNDTASYEHAAAGVTASLTASFSRGPAVTFAGDAAGLAGATDVFVNVENLLGSMLNDTLIGSSGINTLRGGDGDDVLEGMGDGDVLDGGAGVDIATYVHATSLVAVSLTSEAALLSRGFTFVSQGMASGDVFLNIENLSGSDFSDTLVGDAGANTLWGGVGDDILQGMEGADRLDGGAGNNTASYEFSESLGGGLGVVASLTNSASNTGDAQGDVYVSIQNLTGSMFDDSLTGDTGNNTLTGLAGNDVLSGLAGTDTLIGGDGNDTLTDDGVGAARLYGDAGDDRLTLTSTDTTNDVVDGGAGNDWFVWGFSGAGNTAYVNLGVNTFTLSSVSGTVSLLSVENVQTLGSTASLYLYADFNRNNILVANGAARADYLRFFDYLVSGVRVELTDDINNPYGVESGTVLGGSGTDYVYGFERVEWGSYYNDVMIGNSLANAFRGGYGNSGADYIDGGAGSDSVLYDQAPALQVSLLSAAQNQANGFVFGGGAAGDVLLNIENIYGGSGVDLIYGNEQANTIGGQGGADTLEGLGGADYFDGNNSTAWVSFSKSGLGSTWGSSTTGVGVTAVLQVGTGSTASFSQGLNTSVDGFWASTSAETLYQTGDANGDRFVNVWNLLGSGFSDTLVGNLNANSLFGGEGDDVLEGLSGADFFDGGAGNDWVSYQHASSAVTVDLDMGGIIVMTGDAASGTVYDRFTRVENILGSAFNDSLYGDSQDNTLVGGAGDNYLNGAFGTDTVSYAGSPNLVNISSGASDGSFTVTRAGQTDLLEDIERLVGSAFADVFVGGAQDNWIDVGSGGNDVFDGGANSAAGDTVAFRLAVGAVTVTLGEGATAATVSGAAAGKNLTNFENIIGGVYNDTLIGNSGNNTLEGGLGNDRLDGAGGQDTVTYASSASAVTVSLLAGTASGGAGNDTLFNLEHVLGSVWDDTLTGDAGDNTLMGGAGNDWLNGGGGGNDTFDGGLGFDTVSYAGYAAGQTINLGDARFIGIENLTGSANDDVLTGSAFDNTLDGGLGNDVINGGGGNDTVSYLASGSSVTVDLANGTATGGLGNDTLSSIIHMIGSNSDDTLIGNGGNNTLDGGLGNDNLQGGAGTDTVTYARSVTGVTVDLSSGLASGGFGSDVLSSIENVIGSQGNDTLTGTSGVNLLSGGNGVDTLIGGSGADTLIGGNGLDWVSYENASSRVLATLSSTNASGIGDALGDTISEVEHMRGSIYDDTLTGDAGSNTLIGGLGNDSLNGSDGDDFLYANQGNDRALGGNGNDVFYVDASPTNLPTLINGEGRSGDAAALGGNTMFLGGLTTTPYDLTALANVTRNINTLDVRDGVSTAFSLSRNDVLNITQLGVANPNSGSHLFIRTDSGDTLSLVDDSNNALPLGASTGGDYVVAFGAYSGNGVTYNDYAIYNASNALQVVIHWQAAA